MHSVSILSSVVMAEDSVIIGSSYGLMLPKALAAIYPEFLAYCCFLDLFGLMNLAKLDRTGECFTIPLDGLCLQVLF